MTQTLTMQEPYPINQMPDEFRDGRPVLLFGGQWVGKIGKSKPNTSAHVCKCVHGQWVITGCDYYYASVEYPTHFLPINRHAKPTTQA